MIKVLNEIESDIKGKTIDEKYRVREQKESPTNRNIHAWLDQAL